MKAKYILVPNHRPLAGQRRKVRCKCTEGVSAVDYKDKTGKAIHFFVAGKYDGKCKICNCYYFYVE